MSLPGKRIAPRMAAAIRSTNVATDSGESPVMKPDVDKRVVVELRRERQPAPDEIYVELAGLDEHQGVPWLDSPQGIEHAIEISRIERQLFRVRVQFARGSDRCGILCFGVMCR